MLRRSKVVDFPGKYADIPVIRSDRTRRPGRPIARNRTIFRFLPVCVEDGNQPFPLAFSGVRPVLKDFPCLT